MLKLLNNLLLFFLLVKISGEVSAQDTKIGNIKIGEKVPDISLNNMINYPSRNAKISDFKGKLLILDFWNKHCKSCIASFPKMEKIQEKYKSEVQILLVTNDSENDFKKLRKHSPIVKSTNLPYVVNDKELYQIFPHLWEPFHVWIDSAGIVQYMTNGYNTTMESVNQYLKGIKLKLSLRQDSWDIINEYRPLYFEKSKSPIEIIRYYSTISGRLDGVEGSFYGSIYNPVTQKIVGKRLINMSIISLYKSAYDFFYDDSRIIVEGEGPDRFIEPNDKNKVELWRQKNWYCYESYLPGLTHQNRKDIMRYSLISLFKLEGVKEKRKIKCFILVRTTSKEMLRTKGGEKIVEKTKNGYVLRNVEIKSILEILYSENKELLFNITFINETGYSNKIDLDIKSELSDLFSIKEELRKYGLNLIEDEREVELLVLRKIN